MSTDGDYERTHAERWRWTISRLSELLAQISGPKLVLDVGGESKFTAMMRALPGVQVACTGDRDVTSLEDWANVSASIYDVVTCCEVLEHLRDDPRAERHMYTGTGVKNCLIGCHSSLRRGGLLLVTTPNVCGRANLDHVLKGKHPFMYAPHLREMTSEELCAQVARAGFCVGGIESSDVWGTHGMSSQRWQLMGDLISKHGAPDHRGACMLLTARKT